MDLDTQKDPVKKHDEDVDFEVNKEAAIVPLTDSDQDETKDSYNEAAIPAKEDTMGTSDFPPLTELEKQPKLEENGDKVREVDE
jgi:hypothetical protein